MTAVERTVAEATPDAALDPSTTATVRGPVPSPRQVALGGAALDGSDTALRTPPAGAAGVPGEAVPADGLTGSATKLPLRARAAAFLRSMDPRAAVGEHGSRPLVVMTLSASMQGLAAATIAANFTQIFDELQLTSGTIVLLSYIGLVIGAAGPLVGALSDRVRRLTLAIVGCIGFGLGTLVLGLWPSLATFLLARTAQSVFGLAWGNVTTLPLLSDYYPPEVRGRAFAVPQTIGALSGVIGPIVGGVLGTVLGWQLAVTITAVPATLAFAGYLFLKEPVRGRWDRIRLGVSEQTADEAEARAPSLAESWRAAKGIRTLRRIWYAEAFFALGGVSLAPILIELNRRASGSSPVLLGFLIALGALSVTAGIAVGGTLVDVLVARRPGRVLVVQGWVFLVNMAALFVLATVQEPYVLVPILVFQPFLNGLVVTSRDVLTSQVIPARLRSFGLQTTAVWRLGAILALPFIAAVGGDPVKATLLVATPLIGIGALIFLTADLDVEKDIEAARQAALAEEEMARSRRGADGREKLVVCRRVDVHYDGVQVLFGVDLDVEKGELLALLGTNGAGKSTLLRAISGLSQPTGGAIFLDGRDVTYAPAHELARFGVVQVPGGKGVFPTLSVRDNLRAAAWLEPAEEAERTARVLALFPALAARIDTPAGALSGGEQQMLALGQAFLMRPKLLLIDELSLGLAPTVVEQLLQAVEAIRDEGTTIVLVEQSVNLALTVADRAVFMEKGEVRFEGPTEELLRRPEILRSVYLRGSGGAAPASTRPRAATAGGAHASAEAAATVLRAEGVEVSHGGVQALRGASIDVAAGEVVGIIGPNGAGKTTLFDAISGFTPVQAGRVWIGAKDVTGAPPDERARLGLGRSFQDARLFPTLTVAECIQVALQRGRNGITDAAMAAIWAPPTRADERKLRMRADGLIELLGLEAFREKAVGELSTGSRRIVDLACVLAADPDVILLDEPAAGIAQSEAEELAPTLDRIRRDLGCGMLLVEHDMRLVASVADRLVGMVLGAVVATGTVDEVTSHPILVEAYLGTSERVLARSGDPAPTAPRRPRARRSTT